MIFRKTGHKCCFQIIYSCARSIAYLFLNIYDHLSFALILIMVMFIYSYGSTFWTQSHAEVLSAPFLTIQQVHGLAPFPQSSGNQGSISSPSIC